MNKPLISCLCLTERRINYLKRSIQCFLGQSYEYKELVIIYRENDENTVEFISNITDPQIRSYPVPTNQRLTLGDLRNMSIQFSTGEYFCQWDDDDWYHRKRLEQQINQVMETGKAASALSYLIFLNQVTGNAYLSFPRPWENTILCRKKMFNLGFKYASRNTQEDTLFVRDLIVSNNLCAVSSFPTYIYVQHGNNTCSEDHFRNLYAICQPLTNAISRRIQDIVENENTQAASQSLLHEDVLNEFNYFHTMIPHIKKS